VETLWVARLGRSKLELVEPGQAQIAEVGSARAIFGGVLDNEDDLGAESSPDGNAAKLLLHAYLRSGDSLLPTLRGAFGLVVLDKRRTTGLCVRDPLGVCPLFTATAGDELLVSPSIESLLAQPEVSGQVNVPALADHLLHRWPDPAETFFSSVRRIPPGHALRLAPGERRLYRYWEPIPVGGPVDWLTEDEVESFDLLLEQAVTRCLQRGPAGIFLSGGLDSVSVAATAASAARERDLPEPCALSLVFPDPDVNEEDVQTQVASGLGLRQELLHWDEAVGPRGLVQEALELSARCASPLINLWAPAYDRLARRGIDRGCTVILTGSGGDEWLGVTPMYAADLLRTFDVVGLYRLIAAQRRSYELSRVRFFADALWRFGARPLAVEAVAHGAPGLLIARRRGNARATIPSWVAPRPDLRDTLVDRALSADPHQWRPALDKTRPRFYLEELRRSLDHALVSVEMEETFEQGLRVGVPVRAPYWDADLVQLLYRAPVELLNRAGRAKGLVRERLAHRFPELGFERQRKVTSLRFATSLFRSETAAAWASLGGAGTLAEAGVVDERRIEPAVQRLLTQGGDPRSMHRVWDILNLEGWLRARV
jgi:asparagine synthetase B (glutamine-hydrolysing)